MEIIDRSDAVKMTYILANLIILVKMPEVPAVKF
jgi:hypothetical protein